MLSVKQLGLDLSMFSKILENGGRIFGGCLRDMIAGIALRDVDIFFNEEKQESILEIFDNPKNVKFGDDFVMFVDENGLIYDIHFSQDEPAPCCDPDYSVNTLITDGVSVWSWVDSEYSVSQVVKDIRNGLAYEMLPTVERQKKMEGKIFKIMPMRTNDGWAKLFLARLRSYRNYSAAAAPEELPMIEQVYARAFPDAQD